MSRADVADYLAKLDAHLAPLPPTQQIEALEGERERCDRLEAGLARGPMGSSRFTAWDIANISGEIAIRLSKARDAESKHGELVE